MFGAATLLPLVYFDEVLLDGLAGANQFETNPAYHYMGQLLSVLILLSVTLQGLVLDRCVY